MSTKQRKMASREHTIKAIYHEKWTSSLARINVTKKKKMETMLLYLSQRWVHSSYKKKKKLPGEFDAKRCSSCHEILTTLLPLRFHLYSCTEKDDLSPSGSGEIKELICHQIWFLLFSELYFVSGQCLYQALGEREFCLATSENSVLGVQLRKLLCLCGLFLIVLISIAQGRGYFE